MTTDFSKKSSTSISTPLQFHHTLILSFCFFFFVLFFFQSWSMVLFHKLKSVSSLQQVLSLPTKMPSWITTTPFLKSLSKTNQTFINYVWAIQGFLLLFFIYLVFSWKQPFGYIGTFLLFVLTLVSIAILLFFQIFITTFLPTLSSISSVESFSPSPLEPVAQSSLVTQPVPVPSIQTPIPPVQPIQPIQPISFSVILPAPAAIIATSTTATTTTTSTSIVKHLKIVLWVHRVFLAFFLLDILYLLYLLYSSKHSLWGGKSSSSSSSLFSSSSKTISPFSSRSHNRRGRGYGYGYYH